MLETFSSTIIAVVEVLEPRETAVGRIVEHDALLAPWAKHGEMFRNRELQLENLKGKCMNELTGRERSAHRPSGQRT